MTLQLFKTKAQGMTITWRGPQQNQLLSNRGAEQLKIFHVTEKQTGQYIVTGTFQPDPDINDIWNVSGSITLGETETNFVIWINSKMKFETKRVKRQVDVRFIDHYHACPFAQVKRYQQDIL